MALLVSLFTVLAVLSGCASTTATPAVGGSSPPPRTPVRIATLKGPTGVGMVHLMQAQDAGATANDYSFTVTDAPEEVVARVASGDVDVAAVPTNLAAVLHARTSGAVQMLAVNTLGVLYVVTDGTSVSSMAGLKGRTIYASGQGSNPEYVLRFLLRRNGLDPDTDVRLVWKSQHDEVATLVASGNAQVALLPEPFVTAVTVKNPGVGVALDLTTEWSRAVTDGSRLMMGGVIARRDFVEQHPDAVKTFLREYSASIDAARADADTTSALCAQYGIIPDAAVAKQALPRLNLTFLAGEAMQAGLGGYFQVLYDANPAAVGGSLPDAGFYYTTH